MELLIVFVYRVRVCCLFCHYFITSDEIPFMNISYNYGKYNYFNQISLFLHSLGHPLYSVIITFNIFHKLHFFLMGRIKSLWQWNFLCIIWPTYFLPYMVFNTLWMMIYRIHNINLELFNCSCLYSCFFFFLIIFKVIHSIRSNRNEIRSIFDLQCSISIFSMETLSFWTR